MRDASGRLVTKWTREPPLRQSLNRFPSPRIHLQEPHRFWKTELLLSRERHADQLFLLAGRGFLPLVSLELVEMTVAAGGMALVNAHRAVWAKDSGLAAEAELRLTATNLSHEARSSSHCTGK